MRKLSEAFSALKDAEKLPVGGGSFSELFSGGGGCNGKLIGYNGL
jgi:hypothetical protein